MKFKQHPLSAAFPAMQADEYQALADSIGNIGVQNPITLFEGMVIDGWHRYTAANEAGMTCPTVELGDVDPREFVLAQNKTRRHITVGQLAMAANAVYRWAAPGKPVTNQQSSNSALSAELRQPEIAAKSGVSVRSLRQAGEIEKTAAPEVVEAVKRGEVGLPKASAIAKLPIAEQAAALQKPAPKAAAKPTAKPEPVQPEDANYSGPSAAELQSAQETAKTDLDTVMALLESDDPKAALLKENERMRMALAATESQRDGYMNQCNELIRRVKSLRKMLDKAQGK